MSKNGFIVLLGQKKISIETQKIMEACYIIAKINYIFKPNCE